MKSRPIKFLSVFFVVVLISSSYSVFSASAGSSYLKVRPSSDQPEELDSYPREISPFVSMDMKVITSHGYGKPAILNGMYVRIDNSAELSSAVERVVMILNKSKGVDRLEIGRIVANGFYGGGDSIYLYPLHGESIFSFKHRIKMTATVILRNNLNEFRGRKISLSVTDIYANWVNGSSAQVRGYFPLESEAKIINSSDSFLGIINEDETSYGALKYEVPSQSAESVKIKKVFIYGKKKNLKLLVQVEGEENKEFRCKSNSYITACDFGGKGITIPAGSSVTITASESGIFYQGFNTLDVFCEGEDTGRRIFVSPFSNGKG